MKKIIMILVLVFILPISVYADISEWDQLNAEIESNDKDGYYIIEDDILEIDWRGISEADYYLIRIRLAKNGSETSCSKSFTSSKSRIYIDFTELFGDGTYKIWVGAMENGTNIPIKSSQFVKQIKSKSNDNEIRQLIEDRTDFQVLVNGKVKEITHSIWAYESLTNKLENEINKYRDLRENDKKYTLDYVKNSTTIYLGYLKALKSYGTKGYFHQTKGYVSSVVNGKKIRENFDSKLISIWSINNLKNQLSDYADKIETDMTIIISSYEEIDEIDKKLSRLGYNK